MNITSGNLYNLGNASLTVTHNPYNMGTLGGWLRRMGGDTLAYIVAMILIIVLALVPVLILRRSIMIVEVFMIVIGLGISYFADLIPVWVLFVAAIASLAIFVLTRKAEVQ
jgi:hypothetical protein